MKAATYTQHGAFAVLDLPQPIIGSGDLLARVLASSICGTDLRIMRNGHRKLQPGQRIVLGHEFAAEVVQQGEGNMPFPVGTRIGVAPNIGCGHCECCIRGLSNMCPDYTAFGITFDGAHAEYVRIPREALAQGNVLALPDTISPIEASLIEPLSCAVNGNRAARITLGDVVVIYGAGPIGLIHVMLARLTGAGKVIVADMQPQRLEHALAAGADQVIDPAKTPVPAEVAHITRQRGADVAITACSVATVQQEALTLLAPYGRVCLFGGLPAEQTPVPLDTNLIHYKNLLVTGVTGGFPMDFRLALSLLAGKRIDVRPLISQVFPTAEMAAAFDIAGTGSTMKVVIAQEV